MRKLIHLFAVLFLIFTLAACSAGSSTTSTSAAGQTSAVSQTAAQAAGGASTQTTDTGQTVSVAEVLDENTQPEISSGETTFDASAAVAIQLNGDSISAGAGVEVDGSSATITAAGDYILSGSLTDGQIVVNSNADGAVRLILSGVEIHNSSGAAIYIQDAGSAVVILAAGTQNTLTDGAGYVFASAEENEPNAALFSKADLTIAGEGALSVAGSYQDGIASKDGLVIESGAITVQAADDGIRGKDYLYVTGGEITVDAQGDGLKADNEVDGMLGYIAVTGGTVNVTAGGDAINAQTDVSISDGTFNLTAGGGSASDGTSMKGIKGTVSVVIDGGDFTINSADDAIHSNGSVTLNAGVFNLASGDDGIHADETLTVNDGEINISQSYEGLESSVISLNGGNIHVNSSDDGVNVAGGNDGSGMQVGAGRGQPPGGQDAFTYAGDYYLYINGGSLIVDARGDGIDVNGAIVMTDGLVVVNGPTEQMNGALDYDGGFNISGGFVVATGSSGMAMAPDAGSSQNSALIYLTATQPGGTLVHIQNSAGEDLVTFAPTREYQSIAISSPELVNGETYTVYTGGSASGTAVFGLYQDGSYTPGVEATSFSVSNVVTTVGTGGRGPGRGGARP